MTLRSSGVMDVIVSDKLSKAVAIERKPVDVAAECSKQGRESHERRPSTKRPGTKNGKPNYF
jgi:hypothetical protein